jgi:hypothetical protein
LIHSRRSFYIGLIRFPQPEEIMSILVVIGVVWFASTLGLAMALCTAAKRGDSQLEEIGDAA